MVRCTESKPEPQGAESSGPLRAGRAWGALHSIIGGRGSRSRPGRSWCTHIYIVKYVCITFGKEAKQNDVKVPRTLMWVYLYRWRQYCSSIEILLDIAVLCPSARVPVSPSCPRPRPFPAVCWPRFCGPPRPRLRARPPHHSGPQRLLAG